MVAGAALGGGWIIPGVALFISAATFVFSLFEMRRRARVDYVGELEHRIQECEDDRNELRRKVDQLTRQNFNLMQRVLKLEEDAP